MKSSWSSCPSGSAKRTMSWCRNSGRRQQSPNVKKDVYKRQRLATAKQRVSELEVLLCKIYEDNILGKLSDSR